MCQHCGWYALNPCEFVPGEMLICRKDGRPVEETMLDNLPPMSTEPVEVAQTITSDGGSTGYYQFPDYAKELADLIEYKNMTFNVGNIFKACFRLGEKTGTDKMYDINKIIFFALREKALEERRQRK